MRRYYNTDESVIRLRNYIASYERAKVEFIPNISICPSYNIIKKRRTRILKLNERDHQNFNPDDHSNRLQGPFINRMMLPRLLRPARYLKNSDFSVSNQKGPNPNDKNNETESYCNTKDDMTYDTNFHDIFDPVYSSFCQTSKETLDMKNEIITCKGSIQASISEKVVGGDGTRVMNGINSKNYNFDRFHVNEFSESGLESMHEIVDLKSSIKTEGNTNSDNCDFRGSKEWYSMKKNGEWTEGVNTMRNDPNIGA